MAFERGSAQINGLRIDYTSAGETGAAPVLLIHGLASSGRMWLATQQALAPGFRCVAPDLPGHGTSEKPAREWYSVPRFARTVAALSQVLGLERPALVGHSLGGMIALEIAAAGLIEPSQVVLINPVVSGEVNGFTGWLGGASGPLQAVTRQLWPTASRVLAHPPARLPGHLRRKREDLALTTADSVLGSMRAVVSYDLTDRLGRIRVPTLVILGSHDAAVPAGQGMLAVSAIPGATLVTIPSGHHPTDEAPEETLRALASFLGAVRPA